MNPSSKFVKPFGKLGLPAPERRVIPIREPPDKVNGVEQQSRPHPGTS
jgi:hypothetical protein